MVQGAVAYDPRLYAEAESTTLSRGITGQEDNLRAVRTHIRSMFKFNLERKSENSSGPSVVNSTAYPSQKTCQQIQRQLCTSSSPKTSDSPQFSTLYPQLSAVIKLCPVHCGSTCVRYNTSSLTGLRQRSLNTA